MKVSKNSVSGLWLFTMKNHLDNFGSHRLRRSGEITLFICQVTYVIRRSKVQVYFLCSGLSSLAAIRLVEVEI